MQSCKDNQRSYCRNKVDPKKTYDENLEEFRRRMQEVDESINEEDLEYIENHSKKEAAEQSGEKNEKGDEKITKPSPASKDDTDRYSMIVYVDGVAKETTQLPTHKKISFVLKKNREEIKEGITIKDGKVIIKCPKIYDAKDIGKKHTISIEYEGKQRASSNSTVDNSTLN